MSILVSFIIPVYNTSYDRLTACFDSIKKINQFSYEVIIIDDGSSTDTQRFCMSYIERHGVFRYIRKENGGVSSARNRGIKEAEGQYIYFVDSDDELVPDVFEEKWLQMNADIVLTDISVNVNNGNHKVSEIKKDMYISAYEYVNASMRDNYLFGSYAKFIKLELLKDKGIGFDESMLSGEDAVFVFNLMRCRPSIYYAGRVSYIYKFSPGTGDNRLNKHPYRVINDNVHMHKVFCEVIKEISPDRISCEMLVTKTISRFVKQLFNIAASLLEGEQLNLKIKNQIIIAVNQIDKNQLAKCSFGIKIRYYILKKQLWRQLVVIAFIRNKYLAVRGYH